MFYNYCSCSYLLLSVHQRITSSPRKVQLRGIRIHRNGGGLVSFAIYLFRLQNYKKRNSPARKPTHAFGPPSQMRALKKQNAAITLSGVWVFLSARPSRATSRLLPVVELSHNMFRKRVIIPVLIRSANIAPMMGTMRNGLTV